MDLKDLTILSMSRVSGEISAAVSSLGQSTEGVLGKANGMFALVLLPLAVVFFGPIIGLVTTTLNSFAIIFRALMRCVTAWCLGLLRCVTQLAEALRIGPQMIPVLRFAGVVGLAWLAYELIPMYALPVMSISVVIMLISAMTAIYVVHYVGGRSALPKTWVARLDLAVVFASVCGIGMWCVSSGGVGEPVQSVAHTSAERCFTNERLAPDCVPVAPSMRW